jgi:hypothetical protein
MEETNMASPKKRRRKRAIRSVLGVTAPFSSVETADMADSALILNALKYQIRAPVGAGSAPFPLGSLGSEGEVMTDAQQFEFDRVCADGGLGLSKVVNLNTKHLMKLTMSDAPAAATTEWISIGDKVFAFDDAALAATTGTLVAGYDKVDPAGVVTAVKVGTNDAADNTTGLAGALKTAIEHANGFNGQVTVTQAAADLYLSWDPTVIGALPAVQKVGANDAIPGLAQGKGHAAAPSAPVYFMTAAAKADITADHGILFFTNGGGAKYMQATDMNTAAGGTMIADIVPTNFNGATKKLHMKVAIDAATGDSIIIEALDAEQDTVTAFGATDLSGLGLEASSDISAINGLDGVAAGGTLAVSEYVMVWNDTLYDGGLRVTYTNDHNNAGAPNRRNTIMGGGVVVHWYVETWA